MKKFKTVKDGVCFIMDYELTVELIKERKPQLLEDTEDLPEVLVDALCCDYLDSLDACDIWDDFDSAIITHSDWSQTVVIED